jgi:hypothetical protein
MRSRKNLITYNQHMNTEQPDNIIPFNMPMLDVKPTSAPSTSTAPVYKVFQLNDIEWWMAPSLEEAIAASMEQSGLDRDEACDEDIMHELTDKELDTLIFNWGMEEGQQNNPEFQHSFRKELECRIKEGVKTEMFAATDY